MCGNRVGKHVEWEWAKQTRLGRRGAKYPMSEYFRYSPKIPVGLNFQLAFPLGMRTMSKRLVPPRESKVDSEGIEQVLNEGIDNGIGVYLR